RVLDNIFPELESVREVSDDIITVGAGNLIGTTIRNKLVKETLPKMETMHLKVPSNVTPHPAIPDVRTTEAPGNGTQGSAVPPPGQEAQKTPQRISSKPAVKPPVPAQLAGVMGVSTAAPQVSTQPPP